MTPNTTATAEADYATRIAEARLAEAQAERRHGFDSLDAAQARRRRYMIEDERDGWNAAAAKCPTAPAFIPAELAGRSLTIVDAAAFAAIIKLLTPAQMKALSAEHDTNVYPLDITAG